MGDRQKTLVGPATYVGVGLHTGKQCTMRFLPADQDTGVRFARVDLPGAPVVDVRPSNLKPLPLEMRRTVIAQDGVEVHTVEHVLAAVAGLEIDNLIIELDSMEAAEPEDGSADPVVKVLQEAGIREQDAQKRYFRISKPVHYKEEGIEMVAVPYDGFRISFTIQYENPHLGTQYASFDINDEVFVKEISPARTFVLYNDVDRLKRLGMVKGGSLENAIVVDDNGLVNKEPLRFPDEFVRHKVLDFLGDLFLIGRPLRGQFISVRSGHASNVRFVQKVWGEITKASSSERMATLRGGLNKEEAWGIDAIFQIMPHRYPFLLVDKILELEGCKRVVGIKNVTINEPFFSGHFPGHPIMPAVLIIEAMAQVGGVLLLNTVDDPENKLVYFIAIDKAKFRKPVLPGDQMRFELKMLRFGGKICKMKGEAFVDGEPVAEAELTSTIVDR